MGDEGCLDTDPLVCVRGGLLWVEEKSEGGVKKERFVR